MSAGVQRAVLAGIRRPAYAHRAATWPRSAASRVAAVSPAQGGGGGRAHTGSGSRAPGRHALRRRAALGGAPVAREAYDAHNTHEGHEGREAHEGHEGRKGREAHEGRKGREGHGRCRDDDDDRRRVVRDGTDTNWGLERR